MHQRKNTYPFSAIVGQEQMKKALLYNVINPLLGGVLIQGDKGTAKSTAVRALARLLPEIEVVADDPYHSDPDSPEQMGPEAKVRVAAGEKLPRNKRPMPVVEIPLGATEDRLIGTLHVEHALKHGERRFEPGLLAAANRGFLYVDEVNLLDDMLVDLLLDAAAMGVNTVEREGISLTHPSRFIMIGTMNPEEGQLRPQFLDRFALCVTVQGLSSVDERLAVIERREAYERDAAAFCAIWKEQDELIARRIQSAREILPQVQIDETILRKAVSLTSAAGVHGHRADIALIRTTSVIAAWAGRAVATNDDLAEAAALVLPHRLRQTPFRQEQQPQALPEQLMQILQDGTPPDEQQDQQEQEPEDETQDNNESNQNDSKKKLPNKRCTMQNVSV